MEPQAKPSFAPALFIPSTQMKLSEYIDVESGTPEERARAALNTIKLHHSYIRTQIASLPESRSTTEHFDRFSGANSVGEPRRDYASFYAALNKPATHESSSATIPKPSPIPPLGSSETGQKVGNIINDLEQFNEECAKSLKSWEQANGVSITTLEESGSHPQERKKSSDGTLKSATMAPTAPMKGVERTAPTEPASTRPADVAASSAKHGSFRRPSHPSIIPPPYGSEHTNKSPTTSRRNSETLRTTTSDTYVVSPVVQTPSIYYSPNQTPTTPRDTQGDVQMRGVGTYDPERDPRRRSEA